VRKLYELGHITEHSIGYRTIISEYDQNTDVRTLKELQLFEGSSVLWGMNELTPTLTVGGKSEFTLDKIDNEIEKLTKSIAIGSFKDDFYQFLAAKLNYFVVERKKLLTAPQNVVSEPKNEPKKENIKSWLDYI